MSYTASAPLEQLFDPSPARRAAARMTQRAGEELTEEVSRRSPVAEMPKGVVRSGGKRADWIDARGGRKPGTLKDSWLTGDVAWIGPQTVSVESYTEDPVAPHVEWDTLPHAITVRNALALRFWDAAGIIFRQSVWHPGTRGQHMMRDSLAELDVSWRRIGEAELAVWARDQARMVA